MNRNTLWSLFALLTATTSCALKIEPSPRRHGLELSDNWRAAEGEPGTVRPDWWRDFEDQDLDALIRRAFSHNRDLAAAAARLTTAIAQAKAAGAEKEPSLDFGFDSSRIRQNFVGLPIPGSSGVLSTTTNNFGLGLDLSWEPDLWGRLRLGAQVAQEQLNAAGADYHGARLSLAGQTAQAWFATIEARAQLDLAERSAELFGESASRIEARVQSGSRTALDVRLARSEWESARSVVAARRRQLENASRALQVLIGEYPDGVVQEQRTLPSLPAPVPGGVPAQVLERRPDLAAAERRLAAADTALAAARADFYPRVALTASGGTRSNDIGDLLDGDFRVWSIAGNLIAPIFDGGRREAQLEIRKAEQNEALATWAGAVLRAVAEVEVALAAEQHLRSEIEHVRSALNEAQAARRLSDNRFSRGLIDIVTLLTAQRLEVDVESQLIALARQQLELRVDLLLALGGGIPAAGESQPEPSASDAGHQAQ